MWNLPYPKFVLLLQNLQSEGPPRTPDLACEQNDDSENTVPMSIIDGVDTNLNARQNSILKHQENPRKNDLIETPRKRKLRQLISVQENFIKKQKLQIKRLQKENQPVSEKNHKFKRNFEKPQ
ncbi:unnamed protein product [Parnassius apollo]|uniref:(apollo) hypothetical protein n=1 Tax=Parnassius apollo TaxID=110799 RepID=A0A8S3Y1H3_PARAO|nr:unnamed protein product [Parnassius apollo]